MYGYFFTYQDALPENSGFPLFGGVHFIWIAGIAMSIFLLCKVYLRLAKNKRLQMLNAFVLLALCCTFTQDAILTVTGHMNARMLPFHLCDLATFFYLFLQMRILRTGHCDSLAEIALCLFMPGAVLGILFPVWSVYPAFHISRSDHPLSMAAFCQRKRSSQNQTHLAAGTIPLLHCATRLSL